MDFELRTLLRVGGAVGLSLCVLSAALFVAMALTYDEDLNIEPQSGSSMLKRIREWFYFVTLLVGIAVVIGGGVWRVLAWMPATWGEVRATVAGLAAMSAWPIAFALAKLPGMRRTLAVNSAVTDWMRKELDFGAPMSVAVTEQLAKKADEPWASSHERSIAEEKLRLATALLSRDRKLETYFSEKRAREEAHAAADLERIQMEEQRRAALERRAEQVEAALTALVRPLREVRELSELHDDEEAAIDLDTALRVWRPFSKTMMAARPKSLEDLVRARQSFSDGVACLAGVHLCDGAHLDILFQGDERDGYCDAVAVENDKPAPLFNALRFDNTVSGLLNAFFLAATLKRKWSWGHGLYGRDYVLLSTAEELSAHFSDGSLKLPALIGETWPPAGIRLRRHAESTYALACLSKGPNGDVFDLTLSVECRRASTLGMRALYESGRHVLY